MSSPFDTLGNASTLGGVAVGAVVATAGSFAASWYERRLLRRERETDAALVFGELLRTLALQIMVLRTTHGRGDPWGPITIRMARAVRREVEIYDRNRERLFLVRDAKLRPLASSLMARITFAVERVLDNTDALAAGLQGPDADELKTSRDQAFGFLLESADELPALVARFATLAKTTLAELDLEIAGIGMPAERPG